MHKNELILQVQIVRKAILEAIPVGVSFAAIIIALAEVIKMMQEQEFEAEEAAK